ncbi:MAG: hypothetical protein JXA60_00105 [Candidatus Coatesbacteria bacterium]|nr:hypothetical protein [Candidatus Coatesbacteria bacterium]
MIRIYSILLLLTCILEGETSRGINYKYPVISSPTYIYFGTPLGLLKYNIEHKEWSFVTGKVLGGNNVRQIGLDEDYLYVTTEEGLAVSDIRLNDWRVFRKEIAELPVNDICFSTDYVFLACDGGLSLWDKLGQAWKTALENEKVYCIQVVKDNLWLGTEKGIKSYSIKFERFTKYDKQGLPAWRFHSIVQTPSFIWFIADEGLIRYNKELKSFKSYAASASLPVSRETIGYASAEEFWLLNSKADKNGVTILKYETSQDNFFPYIYFDRLPSSKISSAIMSSSDCYFASDKGLTRYLSSEKDWKNYSLTDGLSSVNIEQVFLSGNTIFCINEKGIDKGELDKNQWRQYSWDNLTSVSAFSFLNMTTDKDGLTTKFAEKTNLQIRGNSSHYIKGEKETDSQKDSKNDVNARFNIDEKRSISGFYNDTDEDDVEWGATYRGADRDILKEASVGEQRMAYYQNKIINPITIKGGSAYLQAFYFEEESNQSRLYLKSWAGERISAKTRDYFKGKGRSGSTTRNDTDYLGSIYRLTRTGIVPDEPHKMEIWLDDGNQSNNTRDTRLLTIENQRGNFDRLNPGIDYYYIKEDNVLVMQKSVPSSGLLAAHFTSDGIEYWILIASSSRSQALTNYYSSGGKKIIPHSFHLSIRDSLDRSISLSRFGLDRNSDGMVDEEFFDFQNGILHFPQEKPFNAGCYDPDNPVSTYRLTFQYETEISIFSLKHQEIIQNSETVYLDKLPLDRGNDYILDYSTGSLLIIDENLLSTNSFLEVTYELEKKTGLDLYAGELGIQPLKQARLGGNYIRYKSRHFSSQSLRVDLPGPFKDSSIRIEPEFALSKQDTTNAAYAGRGEIQLRSDIMQVFIDYLRNTEKFENLDTLYNSGGAIRDRISEEATVKPYSWLPISIICGLETSWADSIGSERLLKSKSFQGEISENKPEFPSMTLTALNWSREETEQDVVTNMGKSKISYDLPKELLDNVKIYSLNIEAFYKRNWISEYFTYEDSLPDVKSQESTWYTQFKISPINNLSASVKFEEGKTKDDRASLPWHTSQLGRELTLEITTDALKGFYFKETLEGQYDDFSLQLSPFIVEEEQRRKIKSEIKFYPGQYYTPMNFISLIFDINNEKNGWIRKGANGSLKDIIFTNWNESDFLSLSDPTIYGIGTEITPFSQLSLSSRYDFGKSEEWNYDTEKLLNLNTLTNKIIMKPKDKTQITLKEIDTWNHEEQGAKTVKHNPWISWQENWSSLLLSNLAFTFKNERDSWIEIWEIKRSYGQSLSLTFNFGKHKYIGELIVIPAFNLTRQNSWDWNSYSRRDAMYLDLNIDWNPLSFITTRLYSTAIYSKTDNETSKWNYQFSMEGSIHF